MLANSPIRPVLLATDLEAARAFYHEKLGLPILLEREGAIEFSCGGDTRLAVSKSTTGTADSQTQVAWSVLDLEATLGALRANGIKIEDYDLPGLKTQGWDRGCRLRATWRGSWIRVATAWASCRSAGDRVDDHESRRYPDAPNLPALAMAGIANAGACARSGEEHR